MWKDRIKAAHTAPMTSEDRLRADVRRERQGMILVSIADLREVLSTLDAIRASYAERGEAIETLMRERAT